MAHTTTIQISQGLKQKLEERKLSKGESYEEIIWDLLEDTMEISEETKRNIEKARKQIKEGKLVTFEQVKKNLGI